LSITGEGELEGKMGVPLGIRAVTEVFIDRQGINYDDLLIARTCLRCRRLIYDAEVADIRGQDGFRVIVRAPGARMYVLQGSELLTVHCACGCFYAIVIYGPAGHDGAGYAAYTAVELNGLSQALTGRLRQMRALGDTPADVDAWVSAETVHGVGQAVRLTAKQAFARVSEDWSESRYSSGWVTL
jgi:hypothetical protein